MMGLLVNMLLSLIRFFRSLLKPLLGVAICCNGYVFSAEITPSSLAQEFKQSVSNCVYLPRAVVNAYIKDLDTYLKKTNTQLTTPQYIVLVDRNPNIQVAMIFFGGASLEPWQLIGASSASTGLPGSFDHFLTPLGVFEHSLENLDFRAEGTKNEFGFKGYGDKGMRVYDFGWVKEPQGWGHQKMAVMRLQMHATDPDLAEHLLGVRRSKGCIRISASMNTFIDRFGVLDADYDAAILRGSQFWVLNPDRITTKSPGRYLVVIDSGSIVRPYWALPPKRNVSVYK